MYLTANSVELHDSLAATNWAIHGSGGDRTGTSGNDVFHSIANDVLGGGPGLDVFTVRAGNGSDAIVNFQRGSDTIKLVRYAFTNFDRLKSAAMQLGTDVRIKLSPSESLCIRGVQLPSLTATDFNLPIAGVVAAGARHQLNAFGSAWNAFGWYVVNNSWDSGLASDSYRLTSTFSDSNLTKGTSFNWTYPVMAEVTPTIRAYPEVIFGASPLNTAGGDPTDTAHVFPVIVRDLHSLTAAYDVSFGGHVSGFDVAYDIWLSNSATATGHIAVSNEVMVWLHKGSFDALGTVVGTYSKGDFSATIYHSGTYTAIVAAHDAPTGTIDIADIIAKLEALGILSSTEYLRSVELGAEVVSGSGYLTVNDLSLRVIKAKVSGGTIVDVVTGAGTTVINLATPVASAIGAVHVDQVGRGAGRRR